MRKKYLIAFLICFITAISLMLPVTAFAVESAPKTVRIGWYDSSPEQKKVYADGNESFNAVNPPDKVSFIQFLSDHLNVVIAALTVVFLVIIILLLLKLKADRKANEQQKLLEEASEIVELKQTVSSLLDNMPGMNSTKDAKTGAYLACNQTFAEYGKKSSPEEVIGLTDEDLFDEETAKRLAEDDRMALSMDEPYIFYEDIKGADGNVQHVKTTKLKYTDNDGRLCILGFSQDVTTDAFRIRRETAMTKEDYEKARNSGIAYSHIAQALAQGYSNLFYVDLNTEGFIEYRTDTKNGSLSEERRGWHFFEACMDAVDNFIYPDDQEKVKQVMDRKALVAALEQNSSFIQTCRLVREQRPIYVNIKVTRMQDDDRFIVIGIANVDEQMRQHNLDARMREEQTAYARLSALAGDYLCIYVIVPETGQYRELSATSSFKGFKRSTEGMDFFADTVTLSRFSVYPEDQSLFLSVFTRENVLADVERHGIFTLSYRLLVDGSPRYVQLKAVMLEEKEGRRLIVGVNDIDAQVRQEEEYVRHISRAQMDANIDALTGVKNRHAFFTAEERLNGQLEKNPQTEFAIVVLDVNDLKQVNDIQGHKAGDQFLKDACKIICNTFKHSPVFRVGGDEFTIIVQGDDYDRIDALVKRMHDHNSEALRTGGIVIACGMARNENNTSVNQVSERADQNMYDNKMMLKKKKG